MIGRGAPIRLLLLACLLAGLGTGCRTTTRPGTIAPRVGDEIMVAGQPVHTGTRVILWLDPGGYDAYRVDRRFSPLDRADWEHSRQDNKDLSSPNRYNLRRDGLTPEELERVRGGGWDLPTLQRVVDQFVIHYDVAGVSRQCFRVLQDVRDLSVHFLLDVDGTIYQTLDVKERAWHASGANSRSVGVEIANMGAYPPGEHKPLDEWYAPDARGRLQLTIPKRLGDGGVRTPAFQGRPARAEAVSGRIQGQELVQYDFTPEQYRALAHLTAALCRVLPRIQCDYPHDAAGHVIDHKLSDEELNQYHGILGHYHIQTNKVDPGPAFQWDQVVGEAQRLMRGGFSPAADQTSRGKGDNR